MAESIHPIIYRCNDFVYYMEELKGTYFLHVTINRFSPKVWKKMYKVLGKIQKSYKSPICGYALEESTYKLMKSAGFKETGLNIQLNNGQRRRILCLH